MPGSIVYIGESREGKAIIDITEYDTSNITEKSQARIEDCYPLKESPNVSWINIAGVHDTAMLEKLGEKSGVHPLVLEDIANTGQRPKYDDLESYIFVVLRQLSLDSDTGELNSEQISVVFAENYLISLQEQKSDIFAAVKDRLKRQVPRTRFMGPDYLAYALIDVVVDQYFQILEILGERIEKLQDRLIADPSKEDLEEIHRLKRRLTSLRRSIWPLREVIGGLSRTESRLIHDYTGPYLRDLYDHVVQVIDSIETYREMVSGLLDIYLSSVSNRMNEVMKVLTIIATIFIPLSFLAGVYGMNFNTEISRFNLPELGWRYGYPFFWLIALIVVALLLWLFKRKKWL